MKKSIKFLLHILLIFITVLTLFSFINLNSSQMSYSYFNYGKINPTNVFDFNLQIKDYQETKQWITNPTFFSPINASWSSNRTGDITDVELAEGIGNVSYIVIGDNGNKSCINNYPWDNSTWKKTQDPDHPLFPENTSSPSDSWMDEWGAFARHTWDENVDQVGQIPGVLWKQNITLPVDMRDYNITSASLSTMVNASPSAADVEDPLEAYPGSGDHVRFFIRVSDLSGNITYEVANYLHNDDNLLSDPTYMQTVSNDALIFFLTSILQDDGYHFTITLGINFWCEDNDVGYDLDVWNYARIKSLNLTFTYNKKIDQNTRALWTHTSDILNGREFIINEAKLYFQYKIDSDWPENNSPNSEFKIIINDNIHSETVKLSKINTSSFQDAKSEGFDVKNLIVKNENISLTLEVYIADTFDLADNRTISIDNVFLDITRTILNISILPSEPLPPLILPPGPDWTPIIYLLIAVIAGLLVIFGAYQGYFKYPPTIRKIRKLKKKIKKRKAKTPIQVEKRDSVIQVQLRDQFKMLDLEKLIKEESIKEKIKDKPIDKKRK